MKRVIEEIGTHLAVNTHLVGLSGRERDPRDAGSAGGHGHAHRKWRKRRASGRTK